MKYVIGFEKFKNSVESLFLLFLIHLHCLTLQLAHVIHVGDSIKLFLPRPGQQLSVQMIVVLALSNARMDGWLAYASNVCNKCGLTLTSSTATACMVKM